MVCCLSRHAAFSCGHSGACCSAGWPIPIEAGRLAGARTALADGRLHAEGVGPDEAFLVVEAMPPGAGAVLRTRAGGRCVFHDGSNGRCRIHAALGHEALPSACQHFPRRCVIERDRTAITLSHYCPTVARALFDGVPLRGVVEAPASLAGHIDLEGLDAREALPPLVRPGMLSDLPGFRAWERVVVDLLESERPPEASLAAVRALTEALDGWSPRSGALADAVERAASAARAGTVVPISHPFAASKDAHERVRLAVPESLRPPRAASTLADAGARLVAPGWARYARPLGCFLAAHAFANWTAYFGTGLLTVVRFLETALETVRVEAAAACERAARPLDEALQIEAVRAADLLLVHLADPSALARAIDEEGGGRRTGRRRRSRSTPQ